MIPFFCICWSKFGITFWMSTTAFCFFVKILFIAGVSFFYFCSVCGEVVSSVAQILALVFKN